MRNVICTIVFLCAAIATAQEKKEVLTKAQDEFLVLKKELDAARKKLIDQRDEIHKQLEMATDDAQRKALAKKRDECQKRLETEASMTTFGPRFVDIAEKHAGDPAGIDALAVVLREDSLFVDRLDGPLWQRAVEVARQHYADLPKVKRLLPWLNASLDEASEKFVFAVMEKNPDRSTRARAAQLLARMYQRDAAFAGEFKTDKEMRQQAESERGQEFVEKFIVRGEKAPGELKTLLKQIAENYSDMIPCVGKEAPEAICQDLDGNKVKLSDLKGKVVILDFWATWCRACRAQIPHQRKMVDNLKGKPFVLVSISIDEEREHLEKFLEKEAMPWTHWWAGNKSGVSVDWNHSYVPVIYVLDARGIIRHRDQFGDYPPEKLDSDIRALLEEIHKQ